MPKKPSPAQAFYAELVREYKGAQHLNLEGRRALFRLSSKDRDELIQTLSEKLMLGGAIIAKAARECPVDADALRYAMDLQAGRCKLGTHWVMTEEGHVFVADIAEITVGCFALKANYDKKGGRDKKGGTHFFKDKEHTDMAELYIMGLPEFGWLLHDRGVYVVPDANLTWIKK